MKKYIVGTLLVMALITFGFVHEARADGAAFGGTGSVASWGGAANGGAASSPANNSASNSWGSSSSSSAGDSASRPRPHPVPEPSSLILLASALAGLAGMVVLRKKMNSR